MYATLLWTSLRVPKIDKPLVVYRFYCMALFHSQTRRHMRNIIKSDPFHAVSILELEPFVCHNGRSVARGAKSVFLADTKLSKGQNSVLII